MKRLLFLVFIIVFINVSLAGCGDGDEDMEGERDLGLIDLTYEKGNLNKGDEVEVWIDGDIMDSYPPQADAQNILLKE